METNHKILEVKNLRTHFFADSGEVPAVDGVDFALREGTTLGIVGESGSGKSVTALSIMGLLEGTTGKIVEGEILFDGKNIVGLKRKELRDLRGNEIAMIFQEPMTSLNPVMKIGAQLCEAIKLHQPQTSKDEAMKRAFDILEKTRMPRVEEVLKGYPHQLSGGQRQRVMIAMALICNPKILIADEPTTALDVTIQAQILALMSELKQTSGTSTMLITHDLGVVAETCDDVVVMYCGRVVEQGDVYSIFDNPSHPYTQGLLDSIPKLDDESEMLDSIPGNVPNPLDMPKGCKFAPRCKHVMDICNEEEPTFFEVSEGHFSKCWLHERKGGEV